MIERFLLLLEYLLLQPGPAGPVYTQYAGIAFAVYVTLLASIVVFYFVMRALNGRHALKNWVSRRILLAGGGVAALGLVLLALRPLNWPVLSTRILLAVQLVALLALAGYLWWWLQVRYPERLELYEWEQQKRLYLPKAAGGAGQHAKPKRKRRRG